MDAPRVEHLAVVGDPHGDAGDRLADGADLLPFRPVHRHRRGGLGQPVPLEDGDADAAEEVPKPRRERRAAGDRPLGPAAERGAELAVDQPVEQGVLGPQPQAGPPGVERLAVADGGLGGAGEDLALALGQRLGLRAVVDLLEHARHGEHERRLERR